MMTHLRSARLPSPRRRASGFTLIELMITVAIVGILAAIALPAYSTYVIRGKLVPMTNTLAAARTAMEQYYQDNRTYVSTGSGTSAVTSPCSDTTNWVKSWGSYTLSCPTLTATTYIIQVKADSGAAVGAIYTVNQQNTTATTSYPTKWGGTTGLPSNSSSCWLMRKGDSC
jgi:type IV pilus assembly protein PilE